MFLKLIVCVDVGESRVLIHCWWECELVQPLWTSVWRLLRKLKDPDIALLSSLYIMYPRTQHPITETLLYLHLLLLCSQ